MLDQKNFYINGEWVSPKKPNDLKVIDPSTEEECAVISLGGVEDVNDAVGAAKKAFDRLESYANSVIEFTDEIEKKHDYKIN